MGNWVDIVTQTLFGTQESEVTAENDESKELENNSN